MDLLELVHEDRAAKPFACEDESCGKAFARRSDLVRHSRIHTGDRPWSCPYVDCTRDFIQRSALTVHIRVHTGERPHKCIHPGCGKAFSDSSSLARHRRIHTGKRPYKCVAYLCGKTFCRKTTLTKHTAKHHPDESDELLRAPGAVSFGPRPTSRYVPEQYSPGSSPATPNSDYEDNDYPEPRPASTYTYATRQREAESRYSESLPPLPPLPLLGQPAEQRQRTSGMVSGWAPPVSSLQLQFDHERERIRRHLEEQESQQQTMYAPPPAHPKHMRSEFSSHTQAYEEGFAAAQAQFQQYQLQQRQQQQQDQYDENDYSPGERHQYSSSEHLSPQAHSAYLPTPATTSFSTMPSQHDSHSTPQTSYSHGHHQHHHQQEQELSWSAPATSAQQESDDYWSRQPHQAEYQPSYHQHPGFVTAPLPMYTAPRTRRSSSSQNIHSTTTTERERETFFRAQPSSAGHTGLGITLSPAAAHDPTPSTSSSSRNHVRRFSEVSAPGAAAGDEFGAQATGAMALMMSPSRGAKPLQFGGYSAYMSSTMEEEEQERMDHDALKEDELDAGAEEEYA